MREALVRLSSECALKPTPGPGGGRSLAAAAVQKGYETIVAAGGDGTVNEVLNGIGDVPDGFARARLGVLPFGTVNVFALECCLPARFSAAWEIICQGKERRIDIPRVEIQEMGEGKREKGKNLEVNAASEGKRRGLSNEGSPGQRQHRYFIQMAGAGFDAQAVEVIDRRLKRKLGYFAYAVAVLKALRKRHPPITVTLDSGQTATGEMILLGNGCFYGGRHTFFPHARFDDGLLEVCVFSHIDWKFMLGGLQGMLLRRKPPYGKVQFYRASSLQLTSPSAAPMQVDGEYLGRLPAMVTIVHKALRVIVP